MSDKVEAIVVEEVRTRNDWSWQDYIKDLYKKVLPKVYSRLAKLEAEVAKNRISVD